MRVAQGWRCEASYPGSKSANDLRWPDQGEWAGWQSRPLEELEVVYLWADGIYVKAGLEKEKAVLLVVLAALSDGSKVVVSVTSGYRESTESWSEAEEQRCWNHRIVNILAKVPKREQPPALLILRQKLPWVKVGQMIYPKGVIADKRRLGNNAFSVERQGDLNPG